MKKYRYGSNALLSVILATAFSVRAFANSSWHWLTDAEPFYLFSQRVSGVYGWISISCFNINKRNTDCLQRSEEICNRKKQIS